jgi:hypothetical protein
LEGLVLEDVGIFYGDLLYFKAIRYIVWSFGILFDDLAHFSRYGMLYQEKSGNPDRNNAPKLCPMITDFFENSE